MTSSDTSAETVAALQFHYSRPFLKAWGICSAIAFIEATDGFWWRRVDSNHGPTDYETVALAT
jgi:hypothetical protein